MNLMQVFWIFNINFKKVSFISIFIVVSYKMFNKSRCIFNTFKTIYREGTFVVLLILGNYLHPLLKIQWLLIFIIIFMYLLLAFAYCWIAWHTPPLISFSNIDSISVSVTSFSFTLVFLKAVCVANHGAVRKRMGSSSCMSNTSSQIHHLTTIYHSEHTNHDIFLNFFF